MTEAEELELLELEEEAAKAGAPPSPVSAGAVTQAGPGGREAFLRGGAQGATLGLGDELQGAIQSAPDAALWLNPAGFITGPLKKLAELTSDVPAGQRAAAEVVDEEKTGALSPLDRLRRMGAEYKLNRDSARREDKEAKDAHGGDYFLGNLAGGALTAPLMPGGAVKTAGQAAVQGAKLGAAAGLGGSDADLLEGEVGQAAGDTALGGALGALAGVGARAVPKVVGSGVQKLRDLGESVAARLGRRVLQGGSETLSKGAPIPDATVLDAIRRGVIRFGSTTKGAAERAGAMAEEAGAFYGSILDELEKAGVQGPNAHRIAAEVAKQARAAALTDPIGAGPPLMQRFADTVGEQWTPGAADMPLSVAEGLKRQLQSAASKDFDALRRAGGADLQSSGEARVVLADKLKTAIEDAVERQASKAPELAAKFQPAKAESAALIRLRDLAQKGADKVDKRGPVGLYDMLLATAEGARHGHLAGLATIPASMVARAVGPSSGATTSLAVSELAGALQGLPGSVERALPGIGRAALTAGAGGANALQERIAQALRSGQISPAEAEQLQRQAAQAEALRQ